MYNFYNAAVFISSGNSFSDQTASIGQLSRVLSCNFSINENNDIFEYSDLSFESQEVKLPTVDLSFSYYVTNARNEEDLGFVGNG